MPTEVTAEGLEKISGLHRSVSVQKQMKVNVADSVKMRQDLPSDLHSEAYYLEQQDGDTSNEAIETQVNSLNSQVQNLQRDLQFSVDSDSGRTIIRVIDSETQETIRTIPAEDISAISQRLERHSGVLFNASV